ncbi:Gag-like protein [Operophtera brumata]|uniref:Gag-like protein n=1 Tax=Operophtera brumata TaxID=104452 RepID=A0A0L7KX12_OPEBR|nr:Gag-like protein [Operophtera brumata]
MSKEMSDSRQIPILSSLSGSDMTNTKKTVRVGSGMAGGSHSAPALCLTYFGRKKSRHDVSREPSVNSALEEAAFVDVESGSESDMEISSVVDASGSVALKKVGQKNEYGKRPSSSLFAPGHSDLDSDLESGGVAAAKVNTARRGRSKTSRTGLSRQEFLKSSSLDRGREKILQDRQHGVGRDVIDITTEVNDDIGVVKTGDPSALNAQDLRVWVGEGLATILDVALKSGNLKGEFVGRLNRSASLLREIVDALATRSEAEETQLLSAENSCLRFEVESCKAEVRATASVAAVAAIETQVAPNTLGNQSIVEELKRSLTNTFGQMLDARLAVIEERLLPAPIIRPPLRADAGKVAVIAAPPKSMPEPAIISNPKRGMRASQATPNSIIVPSLASVAGSTTHTETATSTVPQAET